MTTVTCLILALSLTLLSINQIPSLDALDLGLGSNAVTKVNKLLEKLVGSDSLKDNLEFLANYKYDILNAQETLILESLANLESIPSDSKLCTSKYGPALLRYRTTLEKIVKVDKLYGEKFAKYRLVKLLQQYSDEYYKVCTPVLHGICSSLESHDDNEDEAMIYQHMMAVYHYCRPNIIKKKKDKTIKISMIRLECALADLDRFEKGKDLMPNRAVEIGDALAKINSRVKNGKYLEIGDFYGNPELFKKLYEGFFIRTCTEQSEKLANLNEAILLARAPPFKYSQLVDLPPKCAIDIRRAIMCNMLTGANMAELTKLIAGKE